jgi:DNA-binding SARP family transcriptional activator
MALHDLLDKAFETFWEYAPNAKVILLHPRSKYRSVLVAKLINDMSDSTYYYAMGPDDVDVPSFLSGLTHDLADQHPTFGHHLNQIRYDVVDDQKLLLTTLAKDLAEISDEEYMLILDEYDRADSADDLQFFVEKLINYLPPHVRIVLNSRTLPRLPWVSLIAQKKAAVLEDDKLVSSDFYGLPSKEGPHLEVSALGPGYVQLETDTVSTWEGHLPRLLFFFTLDRPVVTRSEICQAFWPDLETDQAVNVFHVTKRRLHKALGFDVLLHEGGYYRVNPEISIHYDVMDFIGALVEGRATEEQTTTAWQRAVDLYKGPFLQGHDDEWILRRRADFQAGYMEALTELAKARQAEGRTEHALTLFLRALEQNSDVEELHRKIMKLYIELGRRSEAVAHYQNLASQLKAKGRKPEPETTALYDEILS